jgi:hypothetical protein
MIPEAATTPPRHLSPSEPRLPKVVIESSLGSMRSTVAELAGMP